jgi:hypothetical protein
MEINITGSLSQEPLYYVYLHRRNDTGTVFYVGKGKNKRAWSKGSRNKHWKHIVEKHGYSIEIIKDRLTELEAFQAEIALIMHYGMDNLVNLTIGGNTSTGYRHTDESKYRQSQASITRKATNPDWYKGCIERITKLHEVQRSDPLFYKKLSELNSEWYAALTPQQKADYINKKTAWLKDDEKVFRAHKKKAETCKSREYLDNQRAKATQHWESLTTEQQQVVITRLTEAARKTAQSSTGIISTSTTYLVNRQVLVPSVKKCSNIFGSGIVSAISEMKLGKRDLVLFKGFIFETYDRNIHTGDYTTDVSLLTPLKSKRWNLKSAVKNSNGEVFLSISEAANSFGNKKTASTADWISRCMKTNRMAMGMYWSRPTEEECKQKLISLLKE